MVISDPILGQTGKIHTLLAPRKRPFKAALNARSEMEVPLPPGKTPVRPRMKQKHVYVSYCPLLIVVPPRHARCTSSSWLLYILVSGKQDCCTSSSLR